MIHFNNVEKNSLLENYLVEFCFDEEVQGDFSTSSANELANLINNDFYLLKNILEGYIKDATFDYNNMENTENIFMIEYKKELLESIKQAKNIIKTFKI